MRKLLFAALLILPATAQAITYQSVRASTANVTTPALQTGAMNLSSGTVQNLNVSALAISGSLTVTGAETVSGNLSVNGVLRATSTVSLGSSGNSVTITSNTVMPGTTVYSGGLYSLVTDSASIIQLVNQIMRYRRPRLVWAGNFEVDTETGTLGTAGSSTIMFPDGSVYTETQSTLLNAVMTSTASWGDRQTAGMRPTEKRTNSSWYNFYAVKSTGTTASLSANTTDFVLVISTWQPTLANYSQLNTNFCNGGTNCWVYLGVVPYGDGSADLGTFETFSQIGNHMTFSNTLTAALTTHGVTLAHTAGATNLTWTYATGTSITSNQVPVQLARGDMAFASAATTQITLLDGAGAYNVMSYAMSSSGALVLVANWPLVRGFRDNNGISTAKDIVLTGYTDSVLSIGGNSQL